MRGYLEEWVAAPVFKFEYKAVEIRRADHATPFIRKQLALTSLTGGCRLVGIIRSRTEIVLFVM
jgi:hypothetical protein